VGIFDDIAHVLDGDADLAGYLNNLPAGTSMDQSHLDAFAAAGGDPSKAQEAAQSTSVGCEGPCCCCCCP
jgi:hypothetical protein